MKNIYEISQNPGSAYDVAFRLAGGDPANRHEEKMFQDGKAAADAALQMREAGWTFLTYDEYGQEVWQPPVYHSTAWSDDIQY